MNNKSATKQVQEVLNKDINTCPVCKSDRFLNPDLKLLVSPCFHKVCESCINRIFTQGPAPCPLCRNILRKQNFVLQTFEDLYVEKEVQLRKKIARTFNKRLDDFKGDQRAYNNYLEEVEGILFNLLNGIDVHATQEKISKYEKENKELIKANIQRQLIEDKVIFSKFEKERRERQMRKEAWQNAVIEEAKMKKNIKNDVMKQISSNPSILNDETGSSNKEKMKSLLNKSKKMKLDLMSILDEQLKKHPNSRLDDDDDELYDMMNYDGNIIGNVNGNKNKNINYLGYNSPIDYDYKPEIIPDIMDNYIDPWLMSLKLDNNENKIKLDGCGFAPSFVFNKSITSAYDSLFVGL